MEAGAETNFSKVKRLVATVLEHGNGYSPFFLLHRWILETQELFPKAFSSSTHKSI